MLIKFSDITSCINLEQKYIPTCAILKLLTNGMPTVTKEIFCGHRDWMTGRLRVFAKRVNSTHNMLLVLAPGHKFYSI